MHELAALIETHEDQIALRCLVRLFDGDPPPDDPGALLEVIHEVISDLVCVLYGNGGRGGVGDTWVTVVELLRVCAALCDVVWDLVAETESELSTPACRAFTAHMFAVLERRRPVATE